MDTSSREFSEIFSSPPPLSANSQMLSVDNSQSANSQIRHFKKLFFLDTHARRPRGTEKPSEGHCSSRLIESFSRNSRDFTICRCKFSNHLRICTFGDLRSCNFQAGRMSGSDGFWSLDSGSACGGRTRGRRGAVPTHVCGVSCVSRAISGADANSQMPGFENLHRFSQNPNLRKTQRVFFDADKIGVTSDNSPGILIRLTPQSFFWSRLPSRRTAFANSQIGRKFSNI